MLDCASRPPVDPHWKAGKLRRRHYPRLIRTFYAPTIRQLVAERHRQGMTQIELTAIVGCTEALLAKWEAGLKLPSLYFLLLWAEALGMELTIGGDDD